MPPEADLIFAAVLVVAIVVIVVALWGKGAAAFKSSVQQLAERGYVVTHARQRHRGPVTWVWGRYEKPVPFYLHFSNRDPVASAAGQLGVADLALGRPAFDAAFYVRSNKPDWAREFMTEDLCEALEKFESLQFLTSSVGNTLSPEYWPDVKPRDRRDLWMLRVDGKLEGAALEPYVELARRLSGAVEQFCAGRGFEPADLETPFLEGK